MVETCLPIDDGDSHELSQYPSTLSVSSAMNLSSSMSSLTLGSPTEKELNSAEYHSSTASGPIEGARRVSGQQHQQFMKQRSFKCKNSKNGSK